jgi:hypothetical protein
MPDQSGSSIDRPGRPEAGDRAGEAGLGPGDCYAGDRRVQAAGIGGEAVLLDGLKPGAQFGAPARKSCRAMSGAEHGPERGAGRLGDDRRGIGIGLPRQQRVELPRV